MKQTHLRNDLKLISNMIEGNSRVLDIGCGNGELLSWLTKNKNVDARGIELSMEGVRNAVSEGLSVVQGDAEIDLPNYPNAAFDYVVLSHTLQAMNKPKLVLEELLRIGKHAIVSIPNFGHWSARFHLLFKGKMPVTKAMPYEWWNTPNIHFCTLKDFVIFCDKTNIFIEDGVSLDEQGNIISYKAASSLANIFARQAIFLLKRI